jgi:hypothetical protein
MSVYTFTVHYDDGESHQSVEAETRPAAEAKLKRRHHGTRKQPVAYQYDGMWLAPPSAWANTP